MAHIDWQLWASIAQVVATVLTGIGIVVSIFIASSALRETRIDRIDRVKPKLLFDKGGQRVDCNLEKAEGIPGVNFNFASNLLKDKPTNARHCIAKGLWGRLTNHGSGAALNTMLTIVTNKIEKAGEEFIVDSTKLDEFPYALSLNRIPAAPSHIAPNEMACFFRLPTPIVVDFTGQLTKMDCTAMITYEDVYGNHYETKQELRAFIERKESSAIVTLTFSDEIPVLNG